jgi:hypothetical protein
MKLLLLTATLLLPLAGFAQQYKIDWWTIDGGGGTSTNGQYAISGTIGQPDAGPTMRGGNYAVTGGFWASATVVQTPGAPLLHIEAATPNVVLRWEVTTPAWNLQTSPSLDPSAIWVAVTNTPIIVDGKYQVTLPAVGNAFFRLSQ